jgi:hypothetical protein
VENKQIDEQLFRFSDGLPPVLRLGAVAELLGIEPARARDLARSGRFPCEVEKIAGRYVVALPEVMAAMGIEDPLLRREDLETGAEFADGCVELDE